jgi:protein phosphatase
VEEPVLLDVNEYKLEPGDIYLMCSDGLSDMVTDADILAILRSNRTMEMKKLALVEAARRGGGRDNISVVLVQVVEDSVRRGLLSRMLGK